jgi:hypothetical protein
MRQVGALMDTSRPHPEGGRLLRAERIRCQLSTRDVETLSRKIATEKDNQEYYISHGWLTDTENGAYVPSSFKLYSLSMIYKRRWDELLAFFGINLEDLRREQMGLPLPKTHLIRSPFETTTLAVEIPEDLTRKVDRSKTNLVSRMFKEWGGMPVSLLGAKHRKRPLYGYVGTEDFTLSPMIRPGSFVEIDASQTRVELSGWHNAFERPIYFVELRDSYACSWCEPGEGRLLLIPYPESRTQVREVRFPEDAGIVGRVTAVSMRIAD